VSVLIVSIEVFTPVEFTDTLVNWALDLVVVACYLVVEVFSKWKNSKLLLSSLIFV